MIGEKIVKIMEEIEPIMKTEQNEGKDYKSPKVEKIIEMVHPLLVKNKVAIIPVAVTSFIPQGNRIFLTMKYHIIDLECNPKDFIEVEIPGSGYDEKGGRAVFAALTGAYRYAMQQSLAIPIVDEIKNDGSDSKNNESEEISNENNVEQPNDINIQSTEELESIDVENLFNSVKLCI